MPLLTSAQISELAVEMLRRSIVLPATVARVANGEYAGPSGGTVTIAVPVPRVAREQTTPGAEITLDALDETPVNVVLRHYYDAAPVTDEDLTLSITDFGRQVLRPQIAAVAEAAEGRIAAAMNGLEPDATITFAATPDPDDDNATVLAIREQLTTNGVPAGDRYLAVSPKIATRLLGIPTFVRASDRGSTDALDKAIIGEVYGLTVVESAALTSGTAIGYHASAFGFGNPAPALPAQIGSGVDATQQNEEGIALRHVLAFDARRLQTISVVSTFAGAAAVLDSGPAITLATSAAGDDIIDTASPHGLVAGDKVRFAGLTGGSGLTADTDYYVIAASLGANTFKVSATPGGSAVNFTTDITAGTVKPEGAHDRAIKVATGS